MSDQDVVHALDAIELLLETEELDGEAVATCRSAFETALVSAERGPGWDAVSARARALNDRLNGAIATLTQRRNAVKQELGLQAKGTRALKGYKPF